MRQWRCLCNPAVKTHPETVGACPECGAVSPYPSLPADQAQRFAELLDWLDAQLASRPGVTGSMVGTGLSAILDAARRDPIGWTDKLEQYAGGLSGMVGWIRSGTPPDEAAMSGMLDAIAG